MAMMAIALPILPGKTPEWRTCMEESPGRASRSSPTPESEPGSTSGRSSSRPDGRPRHRDARRRRSRPFVRQLHDGHRRVQQVVRRARDGGPRRLRAARIRTADRVGRRLRGPSDPARRLTSEADRGPSAFAGGLFRTFLPMVTDRPGPGQPFARDEGRSVFGTVASIYAPGRPDYPERVFEILRDRCGLGPSRRVVDIGAGTGQATQRLLEAGATCRRRRVEPGGRRGAPRRLGPAPTWRWSCPRLRGVAASPVPSRHRCPRRGGMGRAHSDPGGSRRRVRDSPGDRGRRSIRLTEKRPSLTGEGAHGPGRSVTMGKEVRKRPPANADGPGSASEVSRRAGSLGPRSRRPTRSAVRIRAARSRHGRPWRARRTTC